ncbi:hypothetical protein PVAG01_05081 [Phlyctema vagabunda]|uniref:Nudix hydrolase domain-containing protein n=1 Tax=Phlyctema vagabunda TaxID=108571 RepID=A0ABR4PJ09_9HELO
MTETRMQLEDWLDDLCARFIVNLPETDLLSVERICFHVEEAQWYYEDFIRPLDATLPPMSLRTFCVKIFAHCPLLSIFSHQGSITAFEEFMNYKKRIPVRGAVMLNEAMDSAILVKGWKKSAAWSFPRGKINHNEDDLDCAVREVKEETGYDIRASGLVNNPDRWHFQELPLKDQTVGFYFIRDVPMDTFFEPQTRQEISKIQWWKLSDLPGWAKSKTNRNQDDIAVNANKFFMVAPFLGHLKRFISAQRRRDAHNSKNNQYYGKGPAMDETCTEEEQFTDSNTRGPKHNTADRLEFSSFEGTEAALSQLLKVQAPTQGLQEGAMSRISSPQAKPAGQALLALLHGKNQTDAPKPPPHTPLDLTYTQAPVPKTPHHHHPRPPQYSNMPPPPTFPVHPNMHSNQSFSHQLPNNYSNQSFQHNNMQTGFQGHQVYQPYQSHQPQHQMPSPQQRPHPYQPDLIHPQPLPPNVQKAVFTGGQIHSPALPQSVQQQSFPMSQPTAYTSAHKPQFPGLHAPMVAPTTNLSPKLTSHSLALLNAFKNRDQANEDHSNNGGPSSHRYGQEPVEPLRSDPQPQELHAETLQTTSSFAPIGSSNINESLLQPAAGTAHKTTLLEMFRSPPRSAAIPVKGETPKAALLDLFKGGNAQNSAPPPSEAQRSALLGLFKSPNTQPAIPVPKNPGGSMGSSTLPASLVSSAVELSAAEPLTKATLLSTRSNNRPMGQNELGAELPEVNPEVSLPFRATSILARPPQSQTSNVEARSERPKKPVDHQNARTMARKAGANAANKKSAKKQPLPKSPEKPFQPQILKRPQPGMSMVSEVSGHVPSRASTVSMSSPTMPPTIPQPTGNKQALLSMFGQGPITASPTGSASQIARSQAIQPAPPGEQTQKLLSLFGRSPSVANSLIRPQSKDGQPATLPFDAPIDPASRSRVGSLASGAGESRRGSQAPISSADKGFLLNYLDNIAKGNMR